MLLLTFYLYMSTNVNWNYKYYADTFYMREHTIRMKNFLSGIFRKLCYFSIFISVFPEIKLLEYYNKDIRWSQGRKSKIDLAKLYWGLNFLNDRFERLFFK